MVYAGYIRGKVYTRKPIEHYVQWFIIIIVFLLKKKEIKQALIVNGKSILSINYLYFIIMLIVPYETIINLIL